MLPRSFHLLFASFLFACSSAEFTVAPGEPLDVDTSDSGAEETAETSLDSGSTVADTGVVDSVAVLDTGADTGVIDTGTDTGADTWHETAPIDASLEVCEPLPTKDAPHCAASETCAVNAAHKTYCRTVNTAATGEMTCTFDTDCNTNAVCFYSVGATSGKCLLFCRSDADCCSGGPCTTGFDCKKTPLLYTSPVTGATYGTCRT